MPNFLQGKEFGKCKQKYKESVENLKKDQVAYGSWRVLTATGRFHSN
jgi:hypothetical protein